MSLKLFVRRLLLACTILLLLLLAWEAVAGGVRQLPRSSTVGQQVETIVQLGCGLLSLLTVVTCFWWRPWAVAIRRAWAISLVAAAGLSSLVWGPPMLLTTLLFVAVALLVALATLWALPRLVGDEIHTEQQSDRTVDENLTAS